MDQEDIKRKNVRGVTNDAPNNKIRKTNSIETASHAAIIHKSTVTAQFVELWRNGLSGATQEDQDNSPNVQEIDRKYREAVKVIEYLKKKLNDSQENSCELSISMEEIKAENETLRDKLSKAETLTNEFSNIVEYISDTLDRNKEQFKDLQFIKVLNKSLEEEREKLDIEIDRLNEKLKKIEETNQDVLKRKEKELMEFKTKIDEIESKMKVDKEQIDEITVKLEEKQKEISTLKLSQNKLQDIVTDLEKRLSEEKNKIDNLNSSTNKKIKEIKEAHEKELFEAQKNFKKVETEVRMLREEKHKMEQIFEEKEKSIEFFERKVKENETKITTLLEQTLEIETNLEQCIQEKNNIKKQTEEKDIKILRLTQEISSITLDKKLLNDKLNDLNKKLTHDEAEKIKLIDDLARTNAELQEALRKNREIEKSYQSNDESKDHIINQLKRDIEKMDKELTRVIKENSLVRQEAVTDLKQIESNYETEINHLKEKCEKYLDDYYKASKEKNDAIKESLESNTNLKNVTSNLKLQKQVYNKKVEEMKEELTKKTTYIEKLEKDLEKQKASSQNLERINEQLEIVREKENENQYRLERKLSCLDSIVKCLTPSQEMVNKPVCVQKNEATVTQSPIKSILKSPTAQKNFKTPKSPGKRILFSHSNYDQYKIHSIPKSQPVMNNQDDVNSLIFRSSQPAPPSPNNTSTQLTQHQLVSTSKKFFKSKAIKKNNFSS